MNPPANSTEQKASAFPKEAVRRAVAEGKALIKDGKTKVEAATGMYQTLKAADRETIVAAFIEGVGLTPKGALTYFYNCRRRSGKAPKA